MTRFVEKFSVIASFALIAAVLGCNSHEKSVADLQKEYQEASQQYGRDCGEQLLKANPQISQKCKEEEAKMNDAYKRLQAALKK